MGLSPSSLRGLTFIELLIAMSLLAMVIGGLAGLARSSQQGFQYSEGYGTATQHARVAIDRITRTIYTAAANAQFPGCIVIADLIGGWRYPDTMVVWNPDVADDNLANKSCATAVADPNKDPPLYKELVIYCPKYDDQAREWKLVEITDHNNTGQVLVVDGVMDIADFISKINIIKSNAQLHPVSITNLLRACPISTASNAPKRGAVRFETRLRPKSDDVNDRTDWLYSKANPSKENWLYLPWVQGLYGWQTGTRQVWVRMELQLLPPAISSSESAVDRVPVCFFGSAALYYQLPRQ
jgi:hypothetical protein